MEEALTNPAPRKQGGHLVTGANVGQELWQRWTWAGSRCPGHAAGWGLSSWFCLVWDVDRSTGTGQHCSKAEGREAKKLYFN